VYKLNKEKLKSLLVGMSVYITRIMNNSYNINHMTVIAIYCKTHALKNKNHFHN